MLKVRHKINVVFARNLVARKLQERIQMSIDQISMLSNKGLLTIRTTQNEKHSFEEWRYYKESSILISKRISIEGHFLHENEANKCV